MIKQQNNALLCGHTDSVEDLCFKPNSVDILCSVGVDRQLLIWDLRERSSEPIMSLKDLHSSDINTVDWSSCNESLIATGSNDTLVKIVDLRKFQTNHLTNAAGLRASSDSPIVNILKKHNSKVQTVKFCPFSSRYLASSGDSIVLWDLESNGNNKG